MLGFGVAKNNTALKDKLDALIRQDLKNGELNTIYKKYHGADLPKDVTSEGA
jgi:polar amino acid transport system substrate-binding protein